MKNQFELVSEYKPSGDQPEAIRELVSGLKPFLLILVPFGVYQRATVYLKLVPSENGTVTCSVPLP